MAVRHARRDRGGANVVSRRRHDRLELRSVLSAAEPRRSGHDGDGAVPAAFGGAAGAQLRARAAQPHDDLCEPDPDARGDRRLGRDYSAGADRRRAGDVPLAAWRRFYSRARRARPDADRDALVPRRGCDRVVLRHLRVDCQSGRHAGRHHGCVPEGERDDGDTHVHDRRQRAVQHLRGCGAGTRGDVVCHDDRCLLACGGGAGDVLAGRVLRLLRRPRVRRRDGDRFALDARRRRDRWSLQRTDVRAHRQHLRFDGDRHLACSVRGPGEHRRRFRSRSRRTAA